MKHRRTQSFSHRYKPKKKRRFGLCYWHVWDNSIGAPFRYFDSRKEAEGVTMYMMRQLTKNGISLALYDFKEQRILRLFDPTNEIRMKDICSHLDWKY